MPANPVFGAGSEVCLDSLCLALLQLRRRRDIALGTLPSFDLLGWRGRITFIDIYINPVPSHHQEVINARFT